MKKITLFLKKNPVATSILTTIHVPLLVKTHGLFWGTVMFGLFITLLNYQLLTFRPKPVNVIVKNYIKNKQKDSLR